MLLLYQAVASAMESIPRGLKPGFFLSVLEAQA
jgi:hypothetical protein